MSNKRNRINLIFILVDYGDPTVSRDEVYKEIFEQAENFKKNKDK